LFKGKKFQKFYISEVGEFWLRYSSKIKRIKISLNIIGDLFVTVPFTTSYEDAIEFLHESTSWIKKNKIKKHNKEINIISFDLKEDLLNDFKLKTLKKVDNFCYKYNFSYNKIYFKNMISRWGSCSYKNNISLNTLIYYLKDDLQDYVIKHELLHTKIKNHSNQFWIELNKICEDARSKQILINKSYFIKNY
jgi:predicted metal-dependent hydrolase